MSPHAASEQLSALLDGELDETEAAAVEAAVKADPQLQAELDRLRGAQSLLRAHGRVRAPVDFTERLMARVEEEVAAVPWWRRPMGIPLEGLLVAAAAALVLIIALPATNGPQTAPTAVGSAVEGGVAARPDGPQADGGGIAGDVDDQDAVADAQASGAGDAEDRPLTKGGDTPVEAKQATPSAKGSSTKGNEGIATKGTEPGTAEDPDAEASTPTPKEETPGYTLGNVGYEIVIFADDEDVMLALQRVAAVHQGTVQDERGRPTKATSLADYSTQLYVELPAEQVGAFVRELEALGKVEHVQNKDLIQSARLRVPVTIKQVGQPAE